MFNYQTLPVVVGASDSVTVSDPQTGKPTEVKLEALSVPQWWAVDDLIVQETPRLMTFGLVMGERNILDIPTKYKALLKTACVIHLMHVPPSSDGEGGTAEMNRISIDSALAMAFTVPADFVKLSNKCSELNGTESKKLTAALGEELPDGQQNPAADTQT